MDGIGLAAIVAAYILLFTLIVYARWSRRDRQARMDRLRKRGLA